MANLPAPMSADLSDWGWMHLSVGRAASFSEKPPDSSSGLYVATALRLNVVGSCWGSVSGFGLLKSSSAMFFLCEFVVALS